jgi:ethanolamine ammonia-lyase small subunit
VAGELAGGAGADMAVDLSFFTGARVGLERRGASLSTREVLRFDLDHARARDAVWMEMDAGSLGFEHVFVESLARDRKSYLLRPDLGRRVAGRLSRVGCEVALVVSDGLSALAVHWWSG